MNKRNPGKRCITDGKTYRFISQCKVYIFLGLTLLAMQPIVDTHCHAHLRCIALAMEGRALLSAERPPSSRSGNDGGGKARLLS